MTSLKPAPSHATGGAPAQGREPVLDIAQSAMNPQLAISTAAHHPARSAQAAVRIHGVGLAPRRHESLPRKTNICAAAFPAVDINSI